MDALGASGPRSSTRWAVQMQRRCQTATHRASPTRCTPWLRWAGSCPKSFDSLNYTDAAKAPDVNAWTCPKSTIHCARRRQRRCRAMDVVVLKIRQPRRRATGVRGTVAHLSAITTIQGGQYVSLGDLRMARKLAFAVVRCGRGPQAIAFAAPAAGAWSSGPERAVFWSA